MPRLNISEAAPAAPSRVPSTVEAYLTTDVDALSRAEGGLLPHESEALQALYARVQQEHAPPMLSGLQLYEQLKACRLLETGCEGIDGELLRGGMRGGQLVEVCGESASGKTQLCLAAAARAARCGLRVVYADTGNAVSGRRLAEVAHAQAEAAAAAPQQQGAPPPQGPVNLLPFIEVRRCYDVHALLALLDELTQQGLERQHEGQQQQQQQQQGLEQAAGRQGGQQQRQGQEEGQLPLQVGVVRRRLDELPVGLLVVDCLSALIAPILGGGQHSQGHALLAAAAASLKAFAACTQAAVLVTNHMVGGSDERRHEKRPAMGESWRNQPHVRLQLAKPPPGGAGPCIATLRASSMLPAGLAVPYVIGTGGLASPPRAAAAGGGTQGQPMEQG